MGIKQAKTGYYTFLVVYILAIFSISNWIERYQSLSLMLAYGSGFMAYVFLLQNSEDSKTLFNAGIILRVLMFFSLPSLSDDLYRFIWDGTLIKNGIHPFEALPDFYLDKEIPGITNELYALLNSPQYFTVYPPLNQAVFCLSAVIGNGDWLVSANVIRLILYGADVGSFFLIRNLLRENGKSPYLAYWYWLNPLVILEGVGNLHFEVLVIFFLLLGVYGFQKSKNLMSSAGFGLAIGTKLLPLIYLPAVFIIGLRGKKWWISIAAVFIAFITIIPLLNAAFFEGMQSSLNLYFRSFEFNASIYFLARHVGFWIYGYNKIALIGPILSILSFISILTISSLAYLRKWSLTQSLLLILTVYLLFATTVHPWYIIPLIAFGILSGYWYPIVWSLLIFLTYVGYTSEGFELQMYIVVVEYVVVALVLFLELRFKPLKK